MTFFLSMTKRARSGSIGQRHKSADTDPYQYNTDSTLVTTMKKKIRKFYNHLLTHNSHTWDQMSTSKNKEMRYTKCFETGSEIYRQGKNHYPGIR
jgi:hypothetical protein